MWIIIINNIIMYKKNNNTRNKIKNKYIWVFNGNTIINKLCIYKMLQKIYNNNNYIPINDDT